MEISKARGLTVILASALIAWWVLPGLAQVKEPVWVYDPEDQEFGPSVWGEIRKPNGKKLFPECSGGPLNQGNDQTPIDIKDAEAPGLMPIKISYRRTPLNVINDFRKIQVRNGNLRNRLVIEGEAYHLVEFHFHTPSEHTVDGKRYPMDAHFVHTNSHGQLAVLSVAYRVGRRNRTLGTIFANAPRENGTFIGGENMVDGEFLDLRGLLPRMSQYFTYNPGSLTNPPCTEELLWVLLKKPATISQRQVDIFRRILTDVQGFPTNARPLQHPQDRQIFERKRWGGGSDIFGGLKGFHRQGIGALTP